MAFTRPGKQLLKPSQDLSRGSGGLGFVLSLGSGVRWGWQCAGSGAWQFARQLAGTFCCTGSASPVAFMGAELGPLQAGAARGAASPAWEIQVPELSRYLNNSILPELQMQLGTWGWAQGAATTFPGDPRPLEGPPQLATVPLQRACHARAHPRGDHQHPCRCTKGRSCKPLPFPPLGEPLRGRRAEATPRLCLLMSDSFQIVPAIEVVPSSPTGSPQALGRPARPCSASPVLQYLGVFTKENL